MHKEIIVEDEVVINVFNLWKQYGLPLSSYFLCWYKTLMHKMFKCFCRKIDGNLPEIFGKKENFALRNISFQVKRGETLGIIGRNGAGKSTLLKILASVSPPTRGTVDIRGKIFPMIELNAGIHPELTGRENVKLLAAIMGFSFSALKEKMHSIEDFCELNEWFDRPVRMYSSGMMARLGFAVAVNIDADILLIDEVLGVGDFAFQKKCINRIEKLSKEGITILFVSHNPYAIERMCDRAIMLVNGEIVEIGNPLDVVHRYFSIVSSELTSSITKYSNLKIDHERSGTGDLRIIKIIFLTPNETITNEINSGDSIIFRIYYKTSEIIIEPNFAIRLLDYQNTIIASFEATQYKKGSVLNGEGILECHVSSLMVMPNKYIVNVRAAGDVLLDEFNNAAILNVLPAPDVMMRTGNKGIVYIPATWYFHNTIKKKEI